MTEQEHGHEIIPTGIQELDTVLHGGLPKGHVVLLSGDSGTGKTVLSMQWLFSGFQEQDLPGLYITLTEPITSTTKNLESMEFYQRKDVGRSKVYFTDLRSTLKLMELEEKKLDKADVDALVEAIEQIVKETDAERVVIDSITAIAYILEREDLIRTFIFRLGTMLRHHEVTTLLTSEVSGEDYSVYDVEEFISDGIIKLQQESLNNDVRRTLQVIKLRGTDHDDRQHAFTIDGAGINLFTHDLALDIPAYSEKVSTGITGLNTMLYDGVIRGSASLITGPTGAGKTLTGLHFVKNGLEKQENCLFVSFEESKQQLQRMVDNFDWFDEGITHDKLTMICERPQRTPPEQRIKQILDTVDEQDIDRVVIDSLTGIRNSFPEQDFLGFARTLALALKKRGVTSLFTSSHSSMIGTEAVAQNPLSTTMDNILILNYVESRGSLRHTIAILKARSSAHEQALREYDVTEQGIEIGQTMDAYEGVMTGTARKTKETTDAPFWDRIKRRML